MGNKKKSFREWFDENEKVINAGLMGAGCTMFIFGIGYFTGNKMSGLLIDIGLRSLHEDGFIKFFNPSTGMENSLAEHIELMTQIRKNK